MDKYIVYGGKKFEIKEPTISMWTEVMKLKDMLDEDEMHVRMISYVTGLPQKDVLKADAKTIRQVGSELYKFLNQQNKELFKEIEHKGIKYSLVDINKITFGQFVDIDSYLQKDESYRISNLNELAAYLYTESGTDYSDSDFKKRIEAFKDLEIKYLEGAVFFFLSIGRALQPLSELYSKSPVMWQMMRLRIVLQGFGNGIQQLVSLQKTKFGKLIVLLLSPLLVVLTIFLSLWILIRRKKNK